MITKSLGKVRKDDPVLRRHERVLWPGPLGDMREGRIHGVLAQNRFVALVRDDETQYIHLRFRWNLKRVNP